MKSGYYIVIFVTIVTIIGGLIWYSASTIDDVDINNEVVLKKTLIKQGNDENILEAPSENAARRDRKEIGGDDWQKYSSSKGFSFEIPKDWKCSAGMFGVGDVCTSGEIDKKRDTAKIGDYIPDHLTISVHSREVDAYRATIEKEYKIVEEKEVVFEEINLDGEIAYGYFMQGYNENYIVIADFENGVLELLFGEVTKKYSENVKKHILETFQFNE